MCLLCKLSRALTRDRRRLVLVEFGIYVHHVTDTTSGQSVETSTDTLDGDDVQVSCTGVVSAVHDGTTVYPCQLPFHVPISRGSVRVEG